MLRTYKTRRGRLIARHLRELDVRDDLLVDIADLAELPRLFDGRPVTLDLGFGSAAATAQRAVEEPGRGILAIDVHTPGVADLLGEVRSRGLANVRIFHGDAIEALRQGIAPGALAAAWSYFPDPWPKARHHKRRLVQRPFVALLASRVQIDGTWDLATDWPDYAEQMGEVIPADGLWRGGVVARPGRPVTHFEQRAIRDGRIVTDFSFARTDARADARADAQVRAGHPAEADVTSSGDRRAVQDGAA